MAGPEAKKSPTKKKVNGESKINEIIIEGGGQVVKMEIDCSAIVEVKIPEAEKLAKENRLSEALELLLGVEKQTRNGADMHSACKVLVAIVKLCYEAQNWDLLNEHIILLTKKRSQIKTAVAKMVQECCRWIFDNLIESKDEELKLIETLRTVTAGKIYVEVERARLTHKLAKMQEAEGQMAKAASTMHELQVETYGSMDRQEKVELILEQMRYCIATKDFIRTQIISKKISVRFFDKDEHQDLKLRYYDYMIKLDQHEGTYLNICKHYRAVYETPKIKEDPEKKIDTLKLTALYVVLSPYDNEQSDLIHRILSDKLLIELPFYKNLLEKFTTMEIINQNATESFEAELKTDKSAATVFSDTDDGRKRWEDWKLRIVEHNIRIMAKYYRKIKLSRMAELLGLSENAAEEALNTMVIGGTVSAKIDRLDGVVDFRREKDPYEVLNEWSTGISEIMALVMQTTHLINKEEMVHKHMQVMAKPPVAAAMDEDD